MGLRRKALLASVFAFATCFTFLPLTIYIDQRFHLAIFLFPVGAGLYTLTLRCQKCRTLMFKRKVKFWGEDWTYWGGFTIPKRCSNCNTEFD